MALIHVEFANCLKFLEHLHKEFGPIAGYVCVLGMRLLSISYKASGAYIIGFRGLSRVYYTVPLAEKLYCMLHIN